MNIVISVEALLILGVCVALIYALIQMGRYFAKKNKNGNPDAK